MPRIIQPSIEGAVKAALDNTPETSPQPEITRAIMAALEGGGGGTGGGTVKWFATTGDRDAYYADHADELAENPTVGVGDPAVAWQWNGSAWVQSAIALQGPKGDKGDTGPQGPPGVNGVTTVNGFEGNVSIGTASASNIKVQDFFSTSDFAVGDDGKIESAAPSPEPLGPDESTRKTIDNTMGSSFTGLYVVPINLLIEQDGYISHSLNPLVIAPPTPSFNVTVRIYSGFTQSPDTLLETQTVNVPTTSSEQQSLVVDVIKNFPVKASTRYSLTLEVTDESGTGIPVLSTLRLTSWAGITSTGGGPVARKPELFKYGGDAEAGYTPISSNVVTVANTILFIDYILILNGSTGLYYLQDNGSDYSVSATAVTINNPALTDGMKIKIAYYS